MSDLYDARQSDGENTSDEESMREDGQRSLDRLQAWRDRFRKLANEGTSAGTAVWIRILDSLLDDPKARKAWLDLHDDRARQQELSNLAENILQSELASRIKRR